MIRILFHTALALLLSVSTLGVTVNLHYCGDRVYDVALNRPAHACCDPGAKEAHCHHEQQAADKHHCEDHSVRTESPDNFLISGFNFDFEDLHVIDLPLVKSVMNEQPEKAHVLSPGIIQYKKPPPQAVILSEIQSFLV